MKKALQIYKKVVLWTHTNYMYKFYSKIFNSLKFPKKEKFNKGGEE